MVYTLFKTLSMYHSVVVDNIQILVLRILTSENFKIKISCQKITQVIETASKFPFGSSSFLLLFYRSNKCLIFTPNYFLLNAHFWTGFRRDTVFNHTAVSTVQNIHNCTARWNRSTINKVTCIETACKMEIRGLERNHCIEYPKEKQKYYIWIISETTNFTVENTK